MRRLLKSSEHLVTLFLWCSLDEWITLHIWYPLDQWFVRMIWNPPATLTTRKLWNSLVSWLLNDLGAFRITGSLSSYDTICSLGYSVFMVFSLRLVRFSGLVRSLHLAHSLSMAHSIRLTALRIWYFSRRLAHSCVIWLLFCRRTQ